MNLYLDQNQNNKKSKKQSHIQKSIQFLLKYQRNAQIFKQSNSKAVTLRPNI